MCNGETISDSGQCFTAPEKKVRYSIKPSFTGIKHKGEHVRAEWKVTIMDRGGKKVAEMAFPLNIQVEKSFKFGNPCYIDHIFGGEPIINEKARVFFAISPIGFLEFQFALLAQQ